MLDDIEKETTYNSHMKTNAQDRKKIERIKLKLVVGNFTKE